MTIRHGWMAYAVAALVALWPAQSVAGPGDVSLGIGLGGLLDLPDAAQDHTRFGPGPMVMIPVRVGVGPAVNLRFTGRAEMALGQDQLRWTHMVAGAATDFADDDHFSMVALGGLTAGIEVVLPVEGAVRPYFGVGAGAGWVGTFHSLTERTRHLMDPDKNDLQNPKNIDPYTSQLTWLSDVSLGMMTQGPTSFWFEAGYSSAWVPVGSLKKSLAGYDARRDAFGWNPIRLTLGLQFAL